MILQRLMGPRWQDRFGDDALGAGFDDWLSRRFSRLTDYSHKPLEEHPERIALDALIPAWRAGLAKIVTVPCVGYYARVIGPHGLLVTEETRGNPDRYRAALGVFPHRA